MANINEILARAAALRDETALNSISPERAGGIMYDTLLALNELWLQQGAALVISKIYASVAAMEADTEPVSDISGKPLRPGQIVVIASSDSDNGSVYRYNGTDSPSWSLVGSIGNLEPVDSLDSDSTTLPLAAHQGKVLDGKISQLGQEVTELEVSKEIVKDTLFEDSTIYNISDMVSSGTVVSTGMNIIENPDLDKAGLLKAITISNANVTVAGTAQIALFKKIKSGDTVSSFVKVTDIETVEIGVGQNEIDLSHLNWVFDTDMCLGFVATNEQNWQIYDRTHGYQLWIYNIQNDSISKSASFPNLIYNYDVVVETPVDLVSKEELDDALEDYVKTDEMVEYMKARSIHDVFPIYDVSGANYTNEAGLFANRLDISEIPNLQKSGVLKSFKLLSGSVQTASTLKVALFRKVVTNGEVTGFTKVTEIVEVPVSVGATEIDLSFLNWNFDTDMCFGFHINNEAQWLKFDARHGYQGWSYQWSNDTYYKSRYSSISYNIEVYVDSIEYENEFTFDESPTEGSDNFITSGSVYNALREAKEVLSDKVIVVLGDSITWLGGDDCNGRMGYEGKGWTQYFKELANPSSMRSYARSGATWSHTANTVYDITEDTGSLSDDNVIYNQINRLLADTVNPSPDIIIILAGTNDAWYPSARPDAVSVSADTEFANTDGYITEQAVGTLTSIAAAMRYDVEMLKTNFPNAQIIVTTPLQSTKFTMARCFEVGTIIRECAEYLSVECIEQGKKAGIYRAQENTAFLFTYDGAHPSVLGAQMIGNFLLRAVLSICRNKIGS